MNIYHKLKVFYIIRHVIIKHALVKELLILEVQNNDKNVLLSINHPPNQLLTSPSNQSVKIEKKFTSSTKQDIHHSTSINLSK